MKAGISQPLSARWETDRIHPGDLASRGASNGRCPLPSSWAVWQSNLTGAKQEMYSCPARKAWARRDLVQAFLRDKNFLIFSPSAYNTLGLGTTQLYNRTLVYNHKRHGVFALGNRKFDCRVKLRFPKKLTPEFLFVDMLNNIDELAEDKSKLLDESEKKAMEFDRPQLLRALASYGSVATRRRVTGWLHG